MTETYSHEKGEVCVEELGDNRRKLVVTLKDSELYVPIQTCVTSYSTSLIKKIFQIKGPEYICDEIMRDEWPEYVEKHLAYDILGYVDPEMFRDKRVLDFGCGSGASTMVLARMLPGVNITGVELDAEFLEIAKDRVEHYQVGDRVALLLSPDGNSLPEGIGTFDYIFLNAVFEHLLPGEREGILLLLWKHLASGGVLFVNQTPYRWYPLEMHSTNGLLFINYMPDFLTAFVTRRFSKRKLSADSWETLLRKGIRGGSPREILSILNQSVDAKAALLVPNRLGFKDRVDIWRAVSNTGHHIAIKKCLYFIFKVIKFMTGIIPTPTLSLAISKVGAGTSSKCDKSEPALP